MTDFQDRLQTALAADFRIERELGGAGMSRVFVATERALNRTVVVKVLPPELAAGVNVERFRREIQLAAQLQHPHIVPLLTAGDDHGLLWFSMPYIEGESLRGVLTKRGRLSPRDVVRILHDVVDALAYAHARGVVHRDIKPDNILTSGMHALVTDFGVAKALSAAIPVHGGTTTGMAIGTPAYMAPEQLAADPAADHRVDLYAVGLLAYELLTGRSPFSGTSPQATLAAQLTVMPEPPHRSLPDVPEPLSQVIMHCLAKDAANRPASAQALLAELDALPALSGSVASAGSAMGARPWTQRPVVLATAMVAVAATLWAVLPRTQPLATQIEARDAGPGGDVTPRVALRAGSGAGLTMADSLSGGSGTPDGTGDAAALTADGLSAEPAGRDAPAGTVVPLVITRAESLAIAEAVSRRSAQRPSVAGAVEAGARQRAQPGASPSVVTGQMPSSAPLTGARGAAVSAAALAAGAGADTVRIIMKLANGATAEVDRSLLLAEVGRIFADSMGRAIKEMEAVLSKGPRFVRPDLPLPAPPAGASEPRMAMFDARSATRPNTMVSPLLAPPADDRPRVVVTSFTNATGRRELGGMARDAGSLLREAVPADRFDVVSTEMTERASRMHPDKMSLGWALRADFVVTGWVIARGDSLSMVTMLTDVRTGRFTRATENVVAADPAATRPAVESARKQVSLWLDTAATIAARRRASDATRR